MKKLLSLVLLLAVMLGSVAVLSSCGTPDDNGAQINVYLGEGVYDLDPSDYYVSDNAAQLLSLVYEPLFRLTEKGKLECAAADDYEVDEDKRLITVTLKETYWSDGTRVKAEDFVYAWRDVILTPDNASPAAALFYDIENALEVKGGAPINSFGVVPRVYDLEITYREGADYEQLLRNLASIATAPVRQDVANLAPEHWSKSADTIVTNGPFSVKSVDYARGEDSECGALVLERNLGYHQSPNAKDFDNNVRPHRLSTTFGVGDKIVSVSYDDLVNKTVFYLGDASLAERAANKGNAVVGDLASTYTYIFNTEKKPFDDKNVRLALSIALDRAEIIEAITFGKAASGLLPEFSCETLGDRQALISADDELTRAQGLIDAANLSAADMKFTLTVSADEESVAIAEKAKTAWEALGFEVTVKAVDFVDTVVDDKTSGEISVYDSAVQYYVKGAADSGKCGFDIIGIDLQTYSDDGFVALSQFSSEMNGNGVDFVDDEKGLNVNKPVRKGALGGWSNKDYDKLIKEAYEATDDSVREEKLKEAEKILVNEAPVIPVVFNQSFAFVSKDLKKIDFDGFGNFVFSDAKLKNYQDYLEKE